MNNEQVPLVVPVPSPWLDTLLDALSNVQNTLLMVSPYIKDNAITAMEKALLSEVSQQNRSIEIHIITRINPNDFLSGASDISALQQLLNWPAKIPGSTVEMRAIPNVHAKVWVCDRQLAIIGSGNATLPGLNGNLEYGLAVSDPQIVERILSDWQQWWDPAQRVEAPLLEDLAQKLRIIKEGEDMQQIQAQNERINQQVRRLSHVGKAVSFSRKEKQPVSPIVKEQPEPIIAAHTDVTIPESPAYITNPAPTDLEEPNVSQEAIDVPIAALWQALCWVLPLDETASNMISASIASNGYMKLVWKPTPLEHQMLQLIWADGKRYSQASLPVHNETLKQPWAITLNNRQIHMLGETLQVLKNEDFFVKRAHQQFHMLLRTSPYTLSLAYLRNPADRFTSAAIVIPCAPASIPGSFPSLHMPLSCITVVHEQLQNALASLEREWESVQTDGHPLTVIELSFDATGATSCLNISTGQIEAAITISIVGTDCVLAGPEARLRIDFISLQQVISGSSGNVRSWRLCVDRYADAVQFVPEPSVLADTAFVWRHELRNL